MPSPLFRRLALGLAIASLGAAAWAASSIRIDQPWIRPTPPGARTAAGYFTAVNGAAAADRLLSASSPAADKVQMHQSVQSGGMMRMGEVKALDLPAEGSVAFAPGGYHLMFVGLKAPMKAGQSVPVTLRFEKAGPVQARFAVGQPGAPATGTGDHHHH